MAAPTSRVTSSRSLSSAILASLLLAGCSANHANGGTGSVSNTVGYVEMDELVKKHPLYPQLTHVDDGIAAMTLRSQEAGPQLSPAEIAQQEKALEKEMQAAYARTQKLVKDKQLDYSRRENAAMQALILQAGGAVAGPPAGSIGASVNATAAQQEAAARAGAGAGINAYRSDAAKAAQAELDAARRTLAERADGLYRARVEALQQKEGAYSLQLSSDHAAERLSLRTKLSNLALDDADRAAARARLDELERQEADGLAQMRNRDQAELLAYHNQLNAQMQAELTKRSDDIRKKAIAQMNLAAAQSQHDLSGQIGGGGAAAPAVGVVAGAGLSPDVKAKLEALHKQFQTSFDQEMHNAQKDLEKTRQELSKRYGRLHGVDADAEAANEKELGALRKQRSDLYDQIVAEIDGEVRVIAQRRGISVVVGRVLAPAGGVDLTPDAAKVVETLHE